MSLFPLSDTAATIALSLGLLAFIVDMEGYLWKKRYYAHHHKKGVLRQRYVVLNENENSLYFKTSKEGDKVHKRLPLDEILSVVEYGDHGFLMAMRHLATHEACGAAFLFQIEPDGVFEGLSQAETRKVWVDRLKGNINSANDGLDLVLKNQESIHLRYDILLRSPRSVLGTGMSGDVRLIYRKTDKKAFAMKTVSLSGSTPARLGGLRREMDIMKSLDHPHIVRLQETFIEPKLYCRLVLELCEGGELFQRLHKRNYFPEHYVGKLVANMLKALNYLSINNIVHRDLKLENWLFRNKLHATPCLGDQPRSPECTCASCEDADIALIDFGLSRRFRSRDEVMVKSVGTCYYVAPEVLNCRYFGNDCDMWSLGVISFMLLCGKAPFDGKDEQEITINIQQEELDTQAHLNSPWKTVSSDCKDFVSRLLIKDPKKRLSSDEALKHPWVSEHLSCLKAKSQRQKRNTTLVPTTCTVEEHIVDNNVLQRLKKFAKFKELKRLAMEVIAFSLDHNDIKELTELFEEIDSDNDGYITFPEMLQALKDHSELKVEEIREIFNALDEENNGKVHVIEFIAGTLKSKYHLEEQFLIEAFSRLDKGQKGKVTLEDLQRLLGRCGSKERISKIWEQSGLAAKSQTEEIKFHDFMLFMRSDGEAQVHEYSTQTLVSEGQQVRYENLPEVELLHQKRVNANEKINKSSRSVVSKGSSSSRLTKSGMQTLSRMKNFLGGPRTKTLKKDHAAMNPAVGEVMKQV